MKRLIFALFAALSLFGQNVQQNSSAIGNSTNLYAITFNWTASSSGTVPVTAAQAQGFSFQGYRIITAEITPGSPSPTNSYNVFLYDTAGVDLLGGAGQAQSSTTAAAVNGSPTAPPMLGTFSLSVTGNSVNGARGQVIVYLSPIQQTLGLTPTTPTFPSQGADLIFASPCGSTGSPGFRAVCSSDISFFPSWSQITGTKQGTTNVPQMAGTNSGTAGAALCDDSNGNATTSACSTGQPVANVKLFGATGNGSTNDSTAFTNAIAAESTNGGCVFVPPGIYNISITVTSTNNVCITGVPGLSIIKPVATTGTVNAITITGTAGTQTNVTSNVNGNFSGRATNSTHSISVAATTNMSVGSWLLLQYNGNGSCPGNCTFFQVVTIASVATGTCPCTVTTTQAIVIPMDSTQSNTVTVLSPVSNTNISNLVFDGSGYTSNAACGIGLQLNYVIFSNVHDVVFQNYPTVSGTSCGSGSSQGAPSFYTYAGYGNSYHDLKFHDAGEHNGDMWLNLETHFIVHDIQSNYTYVADGSGPDFENSVDGQISNVSVDGASTRGIRIIDDAYLQFTNINASQCADNGVFITWDSYDLQLRNLVLNNDASNGGLTLGGDDESYILIDGVTGYGYSGSNYLIEEASALHDVTIRNISTPVSTNNQIYLYPGKANNKFTFQASEAYTAQYWCTGTATSSTTLYLLAVQVATSAGTPCTNTSVGWSTEVTVPSPGYVRNLQVHAATGGVNSSSGVVTIGVQGSGTTSVTCTLGTGTSCTDLNDQAFVAAGAQLYVQVTTQASETLAGLQISFEY